jgi:hypothetical protein
MQAASELSRRRSWSAGTQEQFSSCHVAPLTLVFFSLFAPRSGINWNVIPAPSQPRLIQIEFPASRVVMNKTPTRRRPKFNRRAQIKTLPPRNKTNTTRPIKLPNNNTSKILIRERPSMRSPRAHRQKCFVHGHRSRACGWIYNGSITPSQPADWSSSLSLARSAHVHNAAPIALSAGPWHVERPPEM